MAQCSEPHLRLKTPSTTAAGYSVWAALFRQHHSGCSVERAADVPRLRSSSYLLMSKDHSLDVVVGQEPSLVSSVGRCTAFTSPATSTRKECDDTMTRTARGIPLDSEVLRWQVLLLNNCNKNIHLLLSYTVHAKGVTAAEAAERGNLPIIFDGQTHAYIQNEIHKDKKNLPSIGGNASQTERAAVRSQLKSSTQQRHRLRWMMLGPLADLMKH